MKAINLKVLALMLTAMLMVFTSCDGDEPGNEGDTTTPVLDENFSYTVNGNDVLFTTTLTGTTWILNTESEVQYNFVNGEVSVNLPMKDTYNFTCNTLVDGAVVSSAAFDVEILETDLSFLESGVWKALTGGADGHKTWVLDAQAVYFHCAYDFYGDAEAGGSADDVWGPWGGFKADEAEVGSIVFDGVTGMATFTLDGVESTGQFTMQVSDRDPDFLTLTNGNTLWEEFEAGKYSYLAPLSEETANLSMAEGIRFPLNKDRVNNWDDEQVQNTTYPSQFLDEDLRNVMIMHASDSALVVRVKRTYEGDAVNKCWLLYNFIVNEYDYPVQEEEVFTYTVNKQTNFTATDLEGTWKFANVSMGWISLEMSGSWGSSAPQNYQQPWSTRQELSDGLTSWGLEGIGDVLAANDDNTYVFNGDGSCTLNGVANTYSVTDGVITFGTALTGTEFNVTLDGSWLSHMFDGTEVTVLDVNKNNDGAGNFVDYTPEGIWLGQSNGADQHKGFQLVKQ